MSEIRLTPHHLTPDIVIAAQDGRVLLRVDLNDGTVEGAVEDMSEAGRIFVKHVRAMFGASTTALSSPPADDVREALARAIAEADAPTLDYERRLPDPPFTEDEDGLRRYSDGETWECYLSHADAILAAFEVRPYGTVTDTDADVDALRRSLYASGLDWSDAGEEGLTDDEFYQAAEKALKDIAAAREARS